MASDASASTSAPAADGAVHRFGFGFRAPVSSKITATAVPETAVDSNQQEHDGTPSATGWEYNLQVSFLEIYNETLKDLLASKEDAGKSLSIKKDAKGGVHLNLVDLAGSERASRSNVSGDRLKETQAINKSLSCLADVFTAIGNKSAHIPFRNSKLTYLLQSSLSGDGKTLMMVNVSPTAESAGETLCSLRFAQQVNKCELGKPKRQIKSKKDTRRNRKLTAQCSLMGPKKDKKAKKGKDKKDDGAENGGVLTPEEQAKLFMSANRSLQMQLAERHEQAIKAMESKRELQDRVATLQRAFEKERTETFGITQDMTRQYKSMQEELLNRVNSLENTNTELRDQLEAARVNFEEMRREKDRVIAAKNAEIQELKAKMEEMAQEFGDMLKETLDKMRERIEITNTSFEHDSGVPMIRRLDEFNLGSPIVLPATMSNGVTHGDLTLFDCPRIRKSEYWQFIKLVAPSGAPPDGQTHWVSQDASDAYCMRCDKMFRFTKGSSNSVRRHMERFHRKELLKRQQQIAEARRGGPLPAPSTEGVGGLPSSALDGGNAEVDSRTLSNGLMHRLLYDDDEDVPSTEALARDADIAHARLCVANEVMTYLQEHQANTAKLDVDFAPFQKIPREKQRRDPKIGTIDKDPEYLAFLEELAKPAEKLPSADLALESKDGAVAEKPVAALVQYLNERRRDKGKTIGLDFYEKKLQFPRDQRLVLQVWDIGGQTINSKMIGKYLFGVHVALLCYDVTDAQSFLDAEDWLRVARSASTLSTTSSDRPMQLYLVGNKTDLIAHRVISTERHDDFIKTHALQGGFLVSARSGDNVLKSVYKISAAAARIQVSDFELSFLDKLNCTRKSVQTRQEDGFP
ncbi:hypothetical protein ATCC90586_005895 [Pythium insidiosum]|nr:hypothetical protein ATCC90586_005895 [Pythium insidiosum]